jgi:hypothetical protein
LNVGRRVEEIEQKKILKRRGLTITGGGAATPGRPTAAGIPYLLVGEENRNRERTERLRKKREKLEFEMKKSVSYPLYITGSTQLVNPDPLN